ncbi:hypothetical protein M3Y94_01177300 [Aphelenchoides besseyi]|nr:hypothetical protein M3Y94_01177300 [Aphelenchoides besseyi]
MGGSPDRKPLMSDLILETLKREQAFRKAQRRRNAWTWGSSNNCIFLGSTHILLGMFLIIYDLATNSTSESAFAISASLCFVIIGILLFIAARRLDRPAHYLIIIFGILTSATCIALIIDTSLHTSRVCIASRGASCTPQTWLVHILLLFIALVELTLCLLSVYASYRYLRHLSTVATDMLYASLISGRYDRLPKPRSEGEQFSISTIEGTNSRPASLQTA